jgi:hypothetical protein
MKMGAGMTKIEDFGIALYPFALDLTDLMNCDILMSS